MTDKSLLTKGNLTKAVAPRLLAQKILHTHTHTHTQRDIHTETHTNRPCQSYDALTRMWLPQTARLYSLSSQPR